MATQPPKKADAPSPAARKETTEAVAPEQPKAAGGLSKMNLIIAASVLAVQAILVVAWLWWSRGPSHASAEPVAKAEEAKPACAETSETLLVEGKATNTKRGATYVYRFKIHGVVAVDDVGAVKAVIEKRKATIEDTIRQVVARLEPKDLDEEPELKTLRRTLMHEFEQIFGPDKIKDLLVPEWTRFKADY